MSGSDSWLPAAQSLAAPPFPGPSLPAQPLPAQPSVPEPRPSERDAGVQAEIVIPVRNEERDLAPSVRRLDAYLRDRFPFTTRITIADNGSTDRTWQEAQALAGELAAVRAVRLERPGRGGALRSIWSASDADVVAYMDVDLSTDLNALLPLLAPLLSGHSDVAIGTRLARGARVIRGPRREIISRCYNLLLHATFGTGFSDAQCGFKAIRADAARALLPLTEDTGWFFDTELLVLAERAGLRIHEVPVDWIDDPDSRVRIIATALADLRGIIRLGTGLARGTISVPVLGNPSPPALRAQAGDPRAGRYGQLAGQLARFVVVGVASTAAYVLLYLLLRGRPDGTGRQRDQPVDHGGGEYGGQPAADVRHPRPDARRPPPAPRPDRVRHRARGHLRRAGRAARRVLAAQPRRRGRGAHRGQSRRHRGPVRALPGLGLPRPRRPRGPVGPAAIPAGRGARPETAPDLVQHQLLDLSE